MTALVIVLVCLLLLSIAKKSRAPHLTDPEYSVPTDWESDDPTEQAVLLALQAGKPVIGNVDANGEWYYTVVE